MMTKKPLIILLGVFLTSIVVVNFVSAFTMGNVDGQWSCIEPINGGCGSATNDYWASGPPSESNDFDEVTDLYTYHQQQSINDIYLYDDWNQVRYGVPTGSEIGFAGQSGFGFDGVDDLADPIEPNTSMPFLLGKFCHFNNPIDAENEMDWVDLVIRVDDLQCDQSADSLQPLPDDILTFTYRFTLDETSNYPVGDDCLGNLAFCPYTIGDDSSCPNQGVVNSNGCADRVDLGALPLEDSFSCYYDGTAVDYKISLLGMIPLTNSLEPCPENPTGDYAYSFISKEETDNCACLYGVVTNVMGTGLILNDFSASLVEDGVELYWETASELNNLGFNLYRSFTEIGMKEKLNETVIPSQVIGSTSGASYYYLDETFMPLNQFFYWLESIDLSGSSETFGPLEVNFIQ